MTSKPVSLRYYLNKKPSGGALILAKAPKQERVEMNLALTMLHYIAVNGSAPDSPVVILNDLSAQEQLTDVFGNVIEGSSARHILVETLEKHGLSNLCEINHTAVDVAGSIIAADKLWDDRRRGVATDRTPILLIMHDAGELCSLRRYLELEYENMPEEEELTEAEQTAETESTEKIEGDGNASVMLSQDDLTGLFTADEMSDFTLSVIGNLFNPKVDVNKIPDSILKKSYDSSKHYSDADVFAALRHLTREGNQQNIFVLIGISDPASIETLVNIHLANKEERNVFSGIFYGSDAVRKTLDVSKDENEDCCFTVPQEVKTRLYDFSDSGEGFFENLKKYY